MSTTHTKYGRVLPVAILVLVVGTLLLRQLPAWRMDLTEESLFSLSDGTVNIVSSLEQPLTLQLYFSESVANDFPQLMDYGQRVSDLLAEYVALNPDRLKLEIIDPEPFSEAEDSATAAGIAGAPVSLGGESFYLGLAVSRDDGAQEVIGFFSPEREA
ncbi:MAG: GldG family protein, partial [Pseudomonadota bacterium]|nr:GldG family protein [Pseudomonadota bacterium]